MANETRLQDTKHPTDVVSDAISAELVQKVVVAPLVYSEDCPADTQVKLWRKDGYASAAETAELNNGLTISRIAQTSVTGTAAKLACAVRTSVEQQRFGSLTPAVAYAKCGQAIGRLWDDTILALLSSVAASVTADAGATADKVLEAVYTVLSSTAGVSSGPLKGVFDYKAIFELRKELLQSGAAALSQERLTTLLAGANGENGYAGSLPGVDLHQTDGIPASGGDDCNAVFDPAIAFGCMADTVIQNRGLWAGAAGGFYDEFCAWTFADAVVWNAEAICLCKSDT